MALIKNKKFKNIFAGKHLQLNPVTKDAYNPIIYPYIGLGNPDAKVLFVGSEKAFNPEISPVINMHELFLNYAHWDDIIENYNGKLVDTLHPILKLRNNALKGFNPYSPLTLDETCYDVYNAGSHTYKKLEKIINSILLTFHSLPPTSIFQTSPKQQLGSAFNYCFLTDISDLPKKRQNEGDAFSFDDFVNSPRYHHLSAAIGDFYRSFQKIVIYAGNTCVGNRNTDLRLQMIRIFNPNLNHDNLVTPPNPVFDKYDCGIGAELIICNQLTSRTFNDDHNLKHLLGVIGIGDIL
jgi:hypothetical protein